MLLLLKEYTIANSINCLKVAISSDGIGLESFSIAHEGIQDLVDSHLCSLKVVEQQHEVEGNLSIRLVVAIESDVVLEPRILALNHSQTIFRELSD